nr:cytochrome c oxidase assembly protein [Frondihabitans sp. VKM Ac-2883]
MFGGAAAPLPLSDPGAVVRFGLPIATFLTELGASLTIGTLALACFALTPVRPEWERSLDIASVGALFWTLASTTAGFFTFLSVAGVAPALDEKFGQSLAFFLTGTDLGLAWLVSTLTAATVTVLCFAVRSVGGVFLVAAIAAGALVPIAQQGHAAGTASHAAAVSALGLHVIGAAVWLGGLLALVLLRPVIERARLSIVLERYSSIALVCFVIVAVSGVVSAQIRIGSWPELGSPYGLLVVVKAVLLILLGLFGVVHRRVVIERVAGSNAGTSAGRQTQKPFWRFVTAEITFLGLASGVAAALARTQTPVSQSVANDTAQLTPAEVLTDSRLPAEFTPLRWLTAGNLDLVWLLGAVFLAAFYLIGVARLRRRGDTWSGWRTGAWILGLVVLVVATNGAPAVYSPYLMSAHLVQVALVAFVVPVLLVRAAPWTLALLAIVKRTDGSRGPREWMLGIVQSRGSAWLTHPVVGGPLLAVTIWAVVWSPLLRWTATTDLGRFCLIAGLVMVGWLFAQSIVGLDPVPVRPGARLTMLLAAVVLVAVGAVGAALALGSGLRLANWYGAMGRTWGPAPLADQASGGVALAGIGIVVCVGLALAAARRRNTD